MRAPKLFLKPFMFMVILFGAIAMITAITFGNRLRREMTREYESKAIALARSMSESDIVNVLDRNAGSLQARINQYKQIAGVSYLMITDEHGEILAHTFIPVAPDDIKELAINIARQDSRDKHTMLSVRYNGAEHLHVAQPILSGMAGFVHVGMNSAIIKRNIREAVIEQQLLILSLLAASTLLGFFYFYSISKPLTQLAQYAEQVGAKRFSNVPVIDSDDELGQLAKAMEAMAGHIAELVGNLENRVMQKTAQLKEARDLLRLKVEERTSELMRANTQLKIEIAERKVVGEALRKTEKKYRDIFEHAVEGIYQTTPTGRFLSANPSMARILGFDDPDEIMGTVYDIGTQLYADPGQRKRFTQLIEENGQVKNFESRIRRRDGRLIWISENARAISNEEGKVLCYEGSAEDITMRKKAEDQLKRQAFHDSLTSLPNRALFLDHLRMAIERGRRRKHLFAVIYMDLDRFKVINDSLGHDAGDDLLRAVARVLEKCGRAMDTIARFGGDEFAILLEEITAPKDAIVIARRILDSMREPFIIGGHEVFTSASMGIVLKTQGYERPEALLRDADTAMYRAKEMGKSRFKVFNQKMHDQALRLMELETDLRRAVDLHEFELAYQPIVDITTRTVSGFEALIRWNHPDHGTISPGDFIPLAEDTGLIYAIDNFVIQRACEQLSTWVERFPRGDKDPLLLNLNISGKHFGHTSLPGQIAQALDQANLDPASLNIEITESALMENPAVAEDILRQVKEIGTNVCIDDFGTGYSSLSYLQRFPIDVVKVDRAFINDVDGNQDSQAIVRTVFSLGESLGLKVVAEGVETEQQLAFLEREGCRYVQGFLFYKPLSAVEVEQLLAQEAH